MINEKGAVALYIGTYFVFAATSKGSRSCEIFHKYYYVDTHIHKYKIIY